MLYQRPVVLWLSTIVAVPNRECPALTTGYKRHSSLVQLWSSQYHPLHVTEIFCLLLSPHHAEIAYHLLTRLINLNHKKALTARLYLYTIK